MKVLFPGEKRKYKTVINAVFSYLELKHSFLSNPKERSKADQRPLRERAVGGRRGPFKRRAHEGHGTHEITPRAQRPRQSHPRAHVAWPPPPTDISGTHAMLVPAKETRGSSEPAGVDWLPVRTGTQRCGSAALSGPIALGADHPSCNLKPCDCQLNGSVLSVGGFQEDLTFCRRNGCWHPGGTYACWEKNGWCLLFRIASRSSLNLFVLGAKIIITCL